MRLLSKFREPKSNERTDRTIEILERSMRHPDPTQLSMRLNEVVRNRTYLQHGVEVHAGDVVLDVGANIGIAAAFFAVECDAGVVHSFEPVRPIFEVLRENIREFPACVPHDYGLSSSSRSDRITYYPDLIELSGFYVDPAVDFANVRRELLNIAGTEEQVDEGLRGRFSTEVLPCELRTVSQVLRDEEIACVDLLKIDVEGAELDVLAGIDDSDWRAIRQVSGELHLDRERRAELTETLRDRGFEVTVVQEPIMRGTPMHLFYATRP
jgi:FkbM family methyltransferase